jgi:hypothetical protein
MAGRTSEFNTEEIELAGATVDMLALANGLAGWCHSSSYDIPLHRTSIYLDPRGRVKRRGNSFSQVDLIFL